MKWIRRAAPPPEQLSDGIDVDAGIGAVGIDADDVDAVDDPGLDLDGDLVSSGRRRFANLGTATRQSLSLRLALGGAVVFVVGLLVTAGAKSYRDLEIVRHREREIAARITASEERLEDQRHRLELLREDPATLERLAREELGLVGEDDIVFVLPSNP